MDPPVIKNGFNSPTFKNNLREVFKTLLYANIIIFSLIIIGYIFLDNPQQQEIIENYRTNAGSAPYFTPIQDFPLIFGENAMRALIMEEVKFRGPVWLLIESGFYLKYITNPLLIVMAVSLNLDWASGHLLFLPIFLAGFPLYRLVYKTKSLWPSVLCHFFYNASIYVYVQLALYLGLI